MSYLEFLIYKPLHLKELYKYVLAQARKFGTYNLQFKLKWSYPMHLKQQQKNYVNSQLLCTNKLLRSSNIAV